jgi:GT2 family glycosyltransferase
METGHAACYTDEVWIRNQKRVNPRNKHRKYSGDIFIQSLPLVIISPSSVMIKREIFDEIGLFDEDLHACEDYDLWLRLTSRYPVHFIDEPLIVKYGGHKDQLSKKYWGLDILRIYALEKILNDSLTDEDRIDAVIKEIIKKSKIVRQGAKNRGNEELVSLYNQKIKEYQRKLSDGR